MIMVLDNVKQYLNKCFNDDGNILEELGFDTQMDNFNNLKQNQLVIEEIKNQFNDKLNTFVYNEYLDQLNNRAEFNSDEFELIDTTSLTTPPTSYNFLDLLNQINDYSRDNGKNEKWDIKSTSTAGCSSTPPTSEIIYHPKSCYPYDSSWASESGISDAMSKLNTMRTLIGDAIADTGSMKAQLTTLNGAYTTYLNTEIDSLGKFLTEMKKITDIVKDYNLEYDDFFSFMNCKFVKENVDVILHNLDTSFGNDVYEIGVYLLIAAFSMPFAISFTILLIMISNEEIEKNKENLIKKNEETKRKSLKNNANNNNNINNINNDITMNKNDGNFTEQRKLKDTNEKIE